MLPLLLCAALLVASAAWKSDDDLALLNHRLLQAMLPPDYTSAWVAAQALAETLRPNGTFPDIDYNEFRRAGWPMIQHLVRCQQMAVAWRGPNASTPPPVAGPSPGQAALLAKTKLALDLWITHDYHNPNWYDNEIGVPRLMGNLALVLGPVLSSTDAAKMVEIMARANWKGGGTVAKPKWTGANLLDMLRIQIHRGVFTNSSSLVAQGFSRAFQDVVAHHQAEESIMVDNSFHQHGPQLLAGAYGAVFTADILSLAVISADTAFKMPVEHVSVFEGLVLDGQAHMSRGATWDWQVHGRGVSEGEGGADTTQMKIGFDTKQMREFGRLLSSLRGVEWAAFADRIDKDDSSEAAALVSNVPFYDSDYVAHNQPEYMFSVHMFSQRTIPASCVNSQGKLDRHLSDGATALYKTGHEYSGIFPVWNWSRPPGTTVASAAEAPNCGNAKHSTGATFVGSASDGLRGVAMQHLAGDKHSDSDTDISSSGSENGSSDERGTTNNTACTDAGGVASVSGKLCCLKSCGQCGGTGCGTRKGGAAGCCGGEIKRSCGKSVHPPCWIGPSPTPLPHGGGGRDAVANKSWLMFETLIVSAGDAERSAAGGLVTSVEQSLLTGTVTIGTTSMGGSKPLTPGSRYHQLDLSSSSYWVLHNNIGYLLPQTAGATAYVGALNKTGAWSSIGVGSDLPVTTAVFDLYIEHAEEYLYMLLPVGATEESLPAALSSHNGYTLAGGGRVGYRAAVDPSGIVLGAVWVGRGPVVVGDWTVIPSRPCAFVLQHHVNGTLVVAASVPGADGGNLTLTVKRPGAAIFGAMMHGPTMTVAASPDGECNAIVGGVEVNIALPRGDYLGSSISVMC